MTTTTRRSSAALAGLALGLTLALTGCGGSDGASDGAGDGSSDGDSAAPAEETTEAAISKDDFLTQGNAICEEGNAALNESLAGLDPSDVEAASAAVQDELVPNIQGQIDDLRALGYPEGDEQTLEDIYTGAEDDLAEISDDPTTFLSDPSILDETNTKLVDYGLTTCGSSS